MTHKQSHPNNPPPVPPHQQPITTPNSIDDMNSSLLKNVSDEPIITNNNMFGKFQGFTLKPLQKDTGPKLNGTKVAYVHPVTKAQDDITIAVLPNRSAPPVPKPPNVVRSQTQTKTTKPIINRTNTTVLPANLESAPALPPLNPGSNPRPLISNPILEASTCTAKELMSPLKNAANYPVRAAPVAPSLQDKSNTNSSNSSLHIENEKDKLKMGSGTLQKIASFLKMDDKFEKKTATLPRNSSTKRSISIDREKLKNIEISAPIPQIENCDEVDISVTLNRVSLTRAQSMRDPVSPTRPTIHTFGSMRQPANLKRPKSFIGVRPKSPPPPRPPAPTEITGLKIPSVPGYQNPPVSKKNIVENNYDDCEAIEAPLAHVSEENSPTSVDNIYAVIEEIPRPVVIPQPNSSKDGLGLLGEIVSEIENRNFDSIYSTTTLKKKKETETKEQYTVATSDTSYANTSEINDDTEKEYSNMNPKSSNASTISSGYIRPSTINTPIARVAPSKPEISTYNTPNSTFSSFKSPEIKLTDNTTEIKSTFKPYSAGSSRTGPLSSTYKNSINKEEKPPLTTTIESDKVVATKPILNRNKTPPQIQSLRTRSPSPKSSKTNTASKIITNNKTTDSSTSSKLTPNTNHTNSIKPKTPQKPTSVQTKLENNKIINRQNSGDKSINKGTSKFQGANMTNNKSDVLLNQKLTSNNHVASKFISNNNEITNSSKTIGKDAINTTANTTNKTLLTNAARPQHGKASNVASLQQKFEIKNNKIKK